MERTLLGGGVTGKEVGLPRQKLSWCVIATVVEDGKRVGERGRE